MTMPHVNSGGTDDFYSSDEVKVYQHEGEEENEKRSSENLSEDKLGLVTEEEDKGGYTGNEKSDRRTEDGKPPSQSDREGAFGGFLPGYPHYHNGSTPTTMPPGAIPPYFFVLQGGKVPMLQSPLGMMMGYNNEAAIGSPPPAHMGIPPVLDPKTGLPRHVYPYPSAPGQFPTSIYSDHVQWQRPPGFPASGTLPLSYPPGYMNSPARYPPGFFPPGVHPGMPHPMMVGGHKDSSDNHRHGFNDGSGSQSPQPEKKKIPHIKKPLNAFMLFMKEQRATVVAECTLKESAAINQILGRRWHSLDRSEQAKYYEMARKEKELHLQLYPGWSARDNYAVHSKKKVKRKKDHPLASGDKGMRPDDRYLDNPAFGDCTNSKKCRARYGMEQQKNWCKPCRRKKKCIRIYDGGCITDGEEDGLSDSVATGDSVHDSDSMLGSPAQSSASEDLLNTPHKAHAHGLDSPLIHDSFREFSDTDLALKSHDVLPSHRSPFSMIKSDRFMPYKRPSSHSDVSYAGSPVSSKTGELNRSYSIESLAKSSVKSEPDYGLSPLPSPGDFGQQNSPKFSLSTFTEDINKNLSPKKPSGLNSSFSISTLSVSSVTPSRVHCS